MIRVLGGAAIAALLLAGCAAGADDSSEQVATGPNAAEQTMAANGSGTETDGDAAGEGIGPVDVCGLFDELDIAGLISAAAADPVSNDDDECTVPAVDENLFAETTIRLGVAPALPVIRAGYEGGASDCTVADGDDIGEGGFTCLEGKAASFVVFVAGEHLVIFSAGNNVNGAPSDELMIESAQQVYANITR